jgi:hypothetical protein
MENMISHTTNKMQINGKLISSTAYGPDSFYIPDFVSAVLQQDPDALFQIFLEGFDWVDRDNTAILYRGKQLSRTKAFFTKNTDVDPDSGLPLQIYKYSYPGFTNRILLQHRCFRAVPALDHLIAAIANGVTFNGSPVTVNHAIATQYISPDDCIGAHQDKLTSITPDTPILSLSFGDTREMQLTDKKTRKLLHTIVMKPGSLFVLGPQTNLTMKHAIVGVDAETLTVRPNKLIQTRISIVL